MSWLFSKRCKEALRQEKMKVSIPLSVRIRIWKVFQDYDDRWLESTETGYNYYTTRLEQLPRQIQSELGITKLLAFTQDGGKAVPSNIEDFVLRGNYPPYLFDAIELFCENLNHNKGAFQTRFNDIMEENTLPWRMANGKIFPVDSNYIEEEITRKAMDLLDEVQFQGALTEFERARIDLLNGYPEGAITNANLAVESTAKEILGIDKIKPGELYHRLIASGIVPDYYQGFLIAFEKNILRCVAIIRNEELGVGHGKGPSRNTISAELAELAVNLSGVLINFLIKQYLKKMNVQTQVNNMTDSESLPF